MEKGSFINRSESVNPYPSPELTPTSRRRAYEALVVYLKDQREMKRKIIQNESNLSESSPFDTNQTSHTHLDEASVSLIDNVSLKLSIHS